MDAELSDEELEELLAPQLKDFSARASRRLTAKHLIMDGASLSPRLRRATTSRSMSTTTISTPGDFSKGSWQEALM
jgi:hypothetical protein